MDLCKFKNIFGKVGEGVHSYRIFDIAIVDMIFTIIGGYIIGKIFKFNVRNTMIVLFLVGILLHRLFCVRTTIDKIIFS
jgi:hypothetical protein